MVSLDESDGGLVTLRFLPPIGPGDERAYLDALKAISDRAGPFVLMTVFGGEGKLSREADREQALWFKATRHQLNERCRALVIVRPVVTERMAEVFRKLWSFPVAVNSDEASAREFLLRHLGQAA
jgi:hypothetical protein